MIDLANFFIVVLVAGAAWLGVSAIVQKRTVRRRRDDKSRDTPHSNTAA